MSSRAGDPTQCMLRGAAAYWMKQPIAHTVSERASDALYMYSIALCFHIPYFLTCHPDSCSLLMCCSSFADSSDFACSPC